MIIKPKYIILFIPERKDRKKLEILRSQMCKRCHTTQALWAPVHMSLTWGSVLKNFSTFENELKDLCKQEKPIPLSAKPMTDIIPERFWTGVSIKNSEQLIKFQKKVESLKNKYASKPDNIYFIPHMTFAFPAKVDYIKPVKNPVQKMILNRVTILKKEEGNWKYKIYKHIKVGY